MNSPRKYTHVLLCLAACAIAGLLLGQVPVFNQSFTVAAAQSGSKNDVGTNPAPNPLVTQNGAAPSCIVNGTVGQGSPDKPGVSGTQSGRIFRDAIPSVCPSKVYPGIFNVGTTYNYDAYTFRNSTAGPLCITVNFNPDAPGTCGTNAHASAYLNSYDPANQGTNYVGDVGSSLAQPFSFTVPGNTDFVVVVTNTASAANCTYTFEVLGVGCTTEPPVNLGPGTNLPANSEMSDQKAGSVLIYNVYTSGATSGNTQNTRINITNVHPQADAFVHLFFVAESCSVADSYICLTANQTSSFLASDLDPGVTGYLVAVAVNGVTGCPENFNFLIGDEYVKFTTGHEANLGAEAISALSVPACDGNSITASLNFNGINYNRVSHALALDNIGSRADGNDTLLILNRIGGNLGTGAGALGTVFGIFYDDAETAVSFTFGGGHQFRSSISNNFPRITPRFETYVPAGRSGWFKVWPTTPTLWGMTGAAINFNPNAASSAGAFNQGHNLHKLTLTNTASYDMPVFPPSC